MTDKRHREPVGLESVTVGYTSGIPGKFWRIRCVSCSGTIDIPRSAGPEQAVKWAGSKGWQADLWKKGGLCPSCARRRKPKTDVDSELPKSKWRERFEQLQIQENVIPMSQAQVTPIREPSADQRFKIRDMLDKHFDDKAGCYLDGMSDQGIADALKVPRVFVERIRDAAYGPIRVDPVIAGLRNEIADLGRNIEGQQKGIDILKGKAGDILSRLEKITGGKAS